MKTSRMVLLVTAATLVGSAIAPASAQDATTASPSVYKVLTENESVRVIEGTYLPGETENWHGHPAYMLYVVDSGRIQVETEGKETKTFDVKSGQYLLSPHAGSRHGGTNIGTDPLRLLIIEFKK